jgi:chromosome segregation ATPase
MDSSDDEYPGSPSQISVSRSVTRSVSPGSIYKNEESHPVFSDFTHIPEMTNISFAASLREENAENIIQRILPLTKFIPAIKMEKRKKKSKKVVVHKEIEECNCDRFDCNVRKSKLQEMKAENKGLREQFRSIETRTTIVKNKYSLIEKATKISEEKILKLQVEVEDLQARITGVEEEVSRADNANKSQREILDGMNNENLEMKKQLKLYLAQINQIYVSETDKVVFPAGKTNKIDEHYKKSLLKGISKAKLKKIVCGDSITSDVQSVMSLDNIPDAYPDSDNEQ